MTRSRRWRGLLAACAAGLVSTSCLTSEATEFEVRVVTTEMEFAPRTIQIAAGRAATFVVENEGDVVHTFSLNELGREVTVRPGQTARLVVRAPAGTYEYVCRILDHAGLGMVGQLVVEPARPA